MKRNSINRRVKSEYLQKVLKSKIPLSNAKRDQRYVCGSNIIPTMSNLMFCHINNFHINSKRVTEEYTDADGIKQYNYVRKSFFEQIENNKYKCLICNSVVDKKIHGGYDVFVNPDGKHHRVPISKYRHIGMICAFDTNPTKTKKTNHIGHSKPEDNSFMTIEDV